MRLGWSCILLFLGCTVDHTGLSPSGETDAATLDAAATPDGFHFDGGPMDASPSVDARPRFDTGPGFDGGPVGADAGRDGGAMDAGRDAGPMDAGRDAGPDSGPPDSGPRDVGVDVDICTTGPDGDMDGVSDVCDRCAGEDDRIDVDGDDIPDACDPWPCSDLPTPAGTVGQEFIEISNVRIGEGTNRAVAESGSSVRVTFDYALNNPDCVGCRSQIEIGSQRAGRLGCVYDDTPPVGGATGSVVRDITLGTPGIAELRFNLGRSGFCAPVAGWWPDAPGPDQTFALICVRE